MPSKNTNGTSRSSSSARRVAKLPIKVAAKLWRIANEILVGCASVWRRLSSRDAREKDFSPSITLGIAEHHRLQVLALTALSHNAFASESLYHELDRARVIPDEALTEDIVRIGSTVTFTTRAGDTYYRVLVHPDHIGEDPHAVSVLSPLGTALIGLRTGQSISWFSYNGEKRDLTVLTVSNEVKSEQDNSARGMQ